MVINSIQKKKSVLKSEYFPFFILLLFLIIIHSIVYGVMQKDDIYFSKALSDHNLFNFLKIRYNGWSSRLIIEALLIAIVHYPLLFSLINITLIMVGCFSISKLFSNSSQKVNWFLVFLFLMFPLHYMFSAGWMATSTNYMWPLMLGIISTNYIRKIYFNQNIKIYEYFIYLLALIYAANQEQMVIVLFIINFFFFVFFFKTKKKIDKFLLLQLFLITLSIIFILTCSGNAIRTISETKIHFPEFTNLSLLTKVEIGYSSTWYRYFLKFDCIFFIFYLLLVLSSISINKSKRLYIYISGIPFLISLFFVLFGSPLKKISPFIYSITNGLTKSGTNPSISNPQTLIPVFLITLILLSIIFTIYTIFFNKNKGVFVIFIFLLGSLTHMLISFSPTIWVSGSRTFTVMSFSIIICSMFIFVELIQMKTPKYYIKIILILSIFLAFGNSIKSIKSSLVYKQENETNKIK